MTHRIAWLAALLLALAAGAAAQQPPAAARAITITTPADDETVHSNAGDVRVAVTVAPRLGAGEKVALALDDREVARGANTRIKLTGVERGTHLLQARLVDAQGDTLAQSDVVTFHLWQASRLFPNRKKP